MSVGRAPNGLEADLRYRGLLAITESISSQTNLCAVFKELTRELRSVLDFDLLTVVLHDAKVNMMHTHVYETKESLQEISRPADVAVVDASPEGVVWQTQQLN